MTIRNYLIGMSFSTLFCFGAWVMVVNNTNPSSAGLLGFAIFYLTLFLALTSFFSLAGFFFRRKVFENITEFKHIEVAFRQGILLALVGVGALLMQSQRVFNVYSAFLFVFIVVSIEMYLSSRK